MRHNRRATKIRIHTCRTFRKSRPDDKRSPLHLSFAFCYLIRNTINSEVPLPRADKLPPSAPFFRRHYNSSLQSPVAHPRDRVFLHVLPMHPSPANFANRPFTSASLLATPSCSEMQVASAPPIFFALVCLIRKSPNRPRRPRKKTTTIISRLAKAPTAKARRNITFPSGKKLKLVIPPTRNVLILLTHRPSNGQARSGKPAR